MPHKALGLMVAAAGLLACVAPQTTGPAAPRIVSRAEIGPEAIGAEVVELVNKERARAGLPAVRWHPRLAESARIQVAFQARSATMSHFGPAGSTLERRLAKVRYDFQKAGESVSRGRVTPLDAVGGWLASPSHKEVLLNPAFTEIGAAVARSDDGTPFWCLVMAAPQRPGR